MWVRISFLALFSTPKRMCASMQWVSFFGIAIVCFSVSAVARALQTLTTQYMRTLYAENNIISNYINENMYSVRVSLRSNAYILSMNVIQRKYYCLCEPLTLFTFIYIYVCACNCFYENQVFLVTRQWVCRSFICRWHHTKNANFIQLRNISKPYKFISFSSNQSSLLLPIKMCTTRFVIFASIPKERIL